MDSFFDQSTDQSRVKAAIVANYFWAWAKVIISVAKIAEIVVSRTGHYKATYTVQSTDAAEAVYFDFTWGVGAVAMADAGANQVQDAESLATIVAIKAQTDKFTFDGSNNVKSTPQTAVSLAANQHVIVDSGTVTTLTNLPAAPQAWLTAQAIDTHALDGKGNWSTYAGGAGNSQRRLQRHSKFVRGGQAVRFAELQRPSLRL